MTSASLIAPALVSIQRDASHPLNNIVNTLLQWFKAYYALERINKHPAETSQPEAAESDDMIFAADYGNWAPTAESSASPPDDQPSGSDPAPVNERVDERTSDELLEIKKLSKKLESHEAMILLLKRSVEGKPWPRRDKTEDKLRPAYVFETEEPQPNSKKRSIKSATEPRSKRSRVSAV